MTKYEAYLVLEHRIGRGEHAEDIEEALEVAKETLKKDHEAEEKESEIPILIECTGQETTANMKLVSVKELEEIGICGMTIAVLYNIDQKLRPFPVFSKVKVLGKECMFYMGRDNELDQDVLVQTDCKSSDFWFGEGE